MIKVTVSGLDAVMKKLDKYNKEFKEKQRIFLEKLADIGIDTADSIFKTAEYDGTKDVVVSKTPEWISENKLRITASGNSVLFIEFGTGVYYSEQHPKAAELGMVRGTYGQGKGSNDKWFFYGEKGSNGKIVNTSPKGDVILTRGNPPARAMYEAGKDVRSKIQEIAREVFSSD